MPRVAVAGATGFTGRLVATQLRESGAEVVLVGRDAARLAEARDAAGGGEVRPVPGWDEAGLSAAFAGCEAVVACAGPFIHAGRPVVAAAIRAGLSYCDSTGEQEYILHVFDSLHQPAQRAGVALVPAFGYDYVPGDLGAALAGEGMGPLERVDVVYAPQSASASLGTRRSALEIMRAPCRQRIGGRLQEEAVGAHRISVDAGFATVTAGSIAAAEPITVPRHLDVRSVVTHMHLPGPLNPGNPGAAMVARAMRVGPLHAAVDRLASRGPQGPQGEQRQAGWSCWVRAIAVDGRRRALLLEGRDVYGFTAKALSALALRFAARSVDVTGACAPAQVVQASAFLVEMGVSVREVAA